MWVIDYHKIIDLFLYHPKEPILFSSGLFLFLFTGFLGIYFLVHKEHRLKTTFVTLFSLYFYYKSSGVYFLILVGSTVVDYLLANAIYKTEKKSHQKIILIISLLINLGMLAYFKYTNFFYDIFCQLQHQPFKAFDIFLPVGVSFFTFQSLSYTLDIYRGNLKPVKNILDYAFFVSFFPQLVAGPIVRAVDFIPQIFKPIKVTNEMIGKAVFLIACGLIKKTIIADYISANFVDRIFENPTLYTGLENLFGTYGYALQIYCDFSGYSDMAIGIALLMGFHFNINFNSPYQSKNITEFWRRWHISLSTWLKDYLYISLGGNRKGKFRTYLNLFITMLVGGLWHGAGFRYILWGGMHGIALAGHKVFITIFPSMKEDQKNITGRFFSIIGTILTFHFVCLCWIFFRAENVGIATQMLNQMMFHFHGNIFPSFMIGYRLVLIIMLIGFILHFIPEEIEKKAQQLVIKMPLIMQFCFFILVIILVVQFKSSEIQPFIYFQF